MTLIQHVDAKLNRADQLLRQIAAKVDAWTADKPFEVRCDLREERRGFKVILEPFRQPFPHEEVGLLIGECVHNLRSSLDNLTYALARLQCDPPERPDRIAFPIALSREHYQPAFTRQLPQAAAERIEQVQPFQRDGSPQNGKPENDPLGLLHRLSIMDKHRVPSVVLFPLNQIDHNLQIEYYSEADASADVPPDQVIWADPVEPGVVLIEHRAKVPIVSVKGQYELQVRVALQADNSMPPLVETLNGLCHYTRMVVNQFRAFFA